MILYTIEVIKGIPTWLNLNELSENQLRQFLWTLVQFIQFLPTFVNSIEVCFQIIDLTVYELICKLTTCKYIWGRFFIIKCVLKIDI